MNHPAAKPWGYRSRLLCSALAGVVISCASAWTGASAATPVQGLVTGEVQRITLDAPGDIWSGATVVVGGQNVVIPRNLLADLPANRLTMQQIFAQAPPACLATHESGLAQTDACNLSRHGAIATIAANKTPGGALIAGDVFIQKGIELINGLVTFINYTDGYFRVNGSDNDPTTGVMVRLNDPTARQTLQHGLGCADGFQNCSPDPRFTEDPDNYTQAFGTGYPLCIPSTVPLLFTDTLGVAGPKGATEPAQAAPDGTGDVLCPSTNRPAPTPGPAGSPPRVIAADSRRFAPLMVGDHVLVQGNFESVNGVRFLSAWHTKVGVLLESPTAADQPDYMTLDSVLIDIPAFFLNRDTSEVIGHTTLSDSKDDALLWTVHRDPSTNAPHDFPMSSVAGCDVASGGCSEILGPQSFRILTQLVGFTKLGSADPCAQLRADPLSRFGAPCPLGGTIAEEFAVLSPAPHEVRGRTGRKFADTANALKSVDITGQDTPNGQFLFPLGMGLGGLSSQVPLVGGSVGALSTPFTFDGIPWNLDRRLSPNGCPNGCEAGPQPLTPFPFSGLDPRRQALSMPHGALGDPVFTASTLSDVSNRILSFVSPVKNNFDGDASLLAYPPVDPGGLPIAVTPVVPGTVIPKVSAFSPSIGAVGTVVAVTGTAFTGATSVTFNGSPGLFRAVSDTVINAVAPAGATSGPIAVTNAAGTAASVGTFTVVVPSVSSFSPVRGPVGTQVTVTGTGLTGATAVSFNGTSAMFSNVSGTTLKATVPPGATPGGVAVTLAGGSVVTTTSTFAVVPSVVTSFTPVSATAGAQISVNGSGFTDATAVAFNGTAAMFSTASDTRILALVPAGASNGPVTVTTPAGVATSATPFTTGVGPTGVTISGIAPASGPVSSTVTINGTAFSNPGPGASVTFNGTPALFSVINDSTIAAAVPEGATSGPITVSFQAGTATSPVFTVTPGVPTGVTATAVSGTQITVGWNASTQPVTAYRVFRDGGATAIATVPAPTTSFADSGLGVGTTHTYTVAAFDGATGNQSPLSSPASATTQAVAMTLDQSSLVFAHTVRDRTLTVTSSGGATLLVGSVSVGTPGANASAFTVTTNTCTGIPRAPGDTCTIGVHFTPPTGVGLGSRTFSATLIINSNAPTSPTGVPLTGTP